MTISNKSKITNEGEGTHFESEHVPAHVDDAGSVSVAVKVSDRRLETHASSQRRMRYPITRELIEYSVILGYN